MSTNNPTFGAHVYFGDGPVFLDEMHDLTDVFMGAIHNSFAGRNIDGCALAGAFVARALGVLRDLEAGDPKGFVKAFAQAADLEDIKPFSRREH